VRRLATLLTLILVAAACRASAAEHKLFAWRVAGDPGTVYLLGSIHVVKPDLYPVPQPIEQAFAVSPELVKEIDTSGSNLALLQQQVLQRGLYTGGDKLESHLSPPTRAALVQAWRTGDTAGMEATATRAVREHPEMQPLIEALVYQRNSAGRGLPEDAEDAVRRRRQPAPGGRSQHPEAARGEGVPDRAVACSIATRQHHWSSA